MRLLFLGMALFYATFIFAQSIPDWENPKVFSINKENTRVTSIPYASEVQALKNHFSSSPFYKSLNGNWQFYWSDKIADVPKEFYLEENYMDNVKPLWAKGTPNQTSGQSGWTLMPVPGNWEFNGYGIPMYVNIGYGIPINPPFIDRNDSPTGAYRHKFDIPKNWDGRRVYLHFEAGTNSMYVWVNGRKVGYTENSKSPAEFDITDYVRSGTNLLACEVHKFSDGYYMEDQDMWRLGGINRGVYLYSTDQTRIQDFFSVADLDAKYKNGIFNVDVDIRNYSKNAVLQSLEVSLLDKAGKKIFTQRKKVKAVASGVEKVGLGGVVKNPLQWTAETPNLYNMLITLRDGKNNIIETTSHRIGFRKVEIKDGQLFVNGKKILVKGVNLHEFNKETGNVVDSVYMLRNIKLMKELNINAVRMSHYPQNPIWYRLCDEHGLYLVDEANLESHGLGQGESNIAYLDEWQDAHLDRMIRMVERDKNHPSVIIWSLGNEASNGKAYYTMYDWTKKRDRSRPVQYEQAYWSNNTDIVCPMYPSWEQMVEVSKKDVGRPYIMCEYAHAMGNSMGNFQDYWDLIRSSKNMQGGFIWEWHNHGFKSKDEQGREYWAYGGDLNGYNKLNDGNFCMDGIISPDQQYLPHTHIVKKVYQNILFESKDAKTGKITVINDFKFIPITPKDYTFKWILLKNGEQIAEGNFEVTISADSRQEVQLNLPKITQEVGVEYFLQVFAFTKRATSIIDAGFEVAKEEFQLEGNNYFVNTMIDGESVKKYEEDKKLTFVANEITFEFGKNDGFRSVKGVDKDYITKFPTPNFWRAPTDNDFGEKANKSLRVWEAASYVQKYHFDGVDEHNGIFTVKYTVKTVGVESKVKLYYTINKDGSLKVDVTYIAVGDDLPELPRFGINLELQNRFQNFTWYGRGPWENYVDRKFDAFMGIWKGNVKDQAHPYYRPQETGNKTDVRWLTLTDDNGMGIRIEGAQPLSVSATNYRIEDLDAGVTKKQQHFVDVKPAKNVILNVDLFQRGVAGLDSWQSPPLDKYRYFGKEYHYSFTLSYIK
ncbi:glycoside hydrolase family 2 TIM barrel-domain containing protein [Sphingobacterium bovistauri]|uniref:beta-galactosidase n=1 Tax=Sphingobacterium bovistauri TaxID=2781959 RepID=A0ABS7Z0R1_9SPHI|nr:glycoside hydrolase family 2 TIM barrel-domain containing protein [Sphingobacterium bovistauri]MCA5003757.1 DUF4981 domain-containing protein [Sphingobacterium bovistauri]